MSSELRLPVPSDSRSRSGERARLRGDLGVASIVFMVTAAASPLAVVVGPVPLGIAGVVLLFFAVGFTAMTPHVWSAGAFSSYVGRGFGRGAGLGAGFAALLSCITLEAGVFGLLGPGLAALSAGGQVLGAPWWVCAASYGARPPPRPGLRGGRSPEHRPAGRGRGGSGPAERA
ncbi:hypothetical protein ACFCV8_08315 [Streptomyces sp. NPDC056347]|uniref:hypothetical protein n=1 Tax=Streptomyces sp. NPDC056347 TaxID=3345790 RepID=UPI0035DD2BE2